MLRTARYREIERLQPDSVGPYDLVNDEIDSRQHEIL